MPKQRAEKRSHSEAFGCEGEGSIQDQDKDNHPASEGHPTIVLHIGSSTLTLGFATDPIPHSLPHIIAYRGCGPTNNDHSHSGTNVISTSKSEVDCDGKPALQERPGEGTSRDDTLVLEYPWEITSELELKREESVKEIHKYLLSSRQASGIRDCEVDTADYLTFNSRVQPVARESEELALTDIKNRPQFLIGNEVLYLPRDSDYTVFKPLRYGRLNNSSDCTLNTSGASGEGGHTKPSYQAVLSMLEDLWTRAVEDYLQIERKDFKNYNVTLLVPDMVDRAMFKECMNILLLRMDFSGACVHQESVCAAYCAGMSTCCVVNVGDEVTHISCVEEGMSNSNSRVLLRYGGSDITRMFYRLLNKTNFPYTKSKPESRLDGVLIQQLKESVCHLDATIWGIRDYQFSVMSSTPGILMDYEIKLSDEGISAAMGVFFPAAFCLPGDRQLIFGQGPQGPDMQDLFDEGHWNPDLLASQQQTQTASEASGSASEVTVGQQLEDLFVGAMHPIKPNESVPEATRRLKALKNGGVLPLDRAVHFSIDCCNSSPETKSKIYSNILLTGGGLSYPGCSTMLQSRLELQLPTPLPGKEDAIEVFSNVRELDPSLVPWKGGAVLSVVDTCHELWIERQEWEFSGVRLLRERAPFLF